MEYNLKTFPSATDKSETDTWFVMWCRALKWRNGFKKELQNLKQGKNMLKWLEENVGDWEASHVSNTLEVFIEALLGFQK